MRIFPAPRPNERGFTFLEISVVVIIIGLMAVFVYPKLSGFLADDDLRITALRLAGTINRVRDQAASTKRPHRLNYSLDANQVWVTVLSDDEFGDDASIFPGPKTLPDSVRFADVSTPEMGKVSGGETFTTFYPNGYADASAIHLEGTRGRIYSIIVNPLTGRTAIYDQHVEQRAIPDLSAE